MARQATARKLRDTRVKNVSAPSRKIGRPFEDGNSGRPKGARNKVTQQMLLSAREAFVPMAELTVKRGTKHLRECKESDCTACRHYETHALNYAYGKPTQVVDIDSSLLREELEKLAQAAGKSIEEVERDAERAGLVLFKQRVG